MKSAQGKRGQLSFFSIARKEAVAKGIRRSFKNRSA
jgi:hypothetical protein